MPLKDGPKMESPKPNMKIPMMKIGADDATVDVAMKA